METQVEELPENRVRLTVAVPPSEVEHAVQHAASDLAGSVKIPGFRKGKVPLPVLVKRIGRERLFTEAVESHIGGWFWNAAAQSRIQPIEQPEYGYDLPASDREPFSFTATVAVQPKPTLVDWAKLEVPRVEATVPDEAIDGELDALRFTVADLSPVDGRPAQPGDTVVVDLVNPGGDAQRDYVIQVGSATVVEELDAALVGMSPGETKQVEYELAEGTKPLVTVTVNEVFEPVLPPLDDDFARAATEFDSLAELRANLEDELRGQLEEEAEAAFRAAAVDALVEASRVEPSGPLVEARTRELVNAQASSLQQRGIALETYLSLTNQTAEQFVERARAEARRSVARELALEAVADQLALDVPDDEVEEVVREQADLAGEDPDATVERLRASGRLERLREDLRLRAALDRVASEVQPISADLASAREKLWTPDKEKPETPTKLWTPASKEPA